VRERNSIVPALTRYFPGQGWERVYERCPCIATNRSFAELQKSRGSGLRNELKRWERRVRELGNLRVEQVRPPLDEDLLAELESVERQSWKWTQGDSAFHESSQRQFILAILRDARADVAVWLMRVSDRLVAFALVLVGHDRWYYYLPSYRKDVPNAGSLLLAKIVEAACLGGCAVVDLLRGEHGYKLAWTSELDTVYEIVWPASLLGRGAALLYPARWRASRSKYLRNLRARLWRVGDRRQGRHPGEGGEPLAKGSVSIGDLGR